MKLLPEKPIEMLKGETTRLMYMGIALSIGCMLWNFNLVGEAKVLIIGVGTLALNLARSKRDGKRETDA